MPQAIPLVVGLGATGAAGAAAAAGTGTILGLTATAWTAVSVGLGVAGTLAQTLLAETPDKPKMQDGDVSIKQAIPPRVRGYGRQRVGGTFLFYDSNPDGDLKTLVCHVAHEIDAWEEDWLNDERVTLDEDGNVTDDPWWQAGDDDSVVVIQHYLGAPDQVIPSFDEKWTADHKAHGLCCAYVKYSDLKDEEQIKVFPSGPPPYRAVLRLAKIYDPRTAQDPEDEATYAWSDNSALVLLDFMTRLEQGVPVGFGIPLDRVDLASFGAAADICDQSVALKAGGTEARWRSWGLYELTEDRKAVLQDLLDACGGRIIQGPDGRLGLTVGAPGPTAAVTLTDDQILEWNLNQGKAAIERINEVRATYVSQAWEWAETEAGIQMDQAAIDRNGVESSQIKLRFVPSESQAQRVAREVLRRGNPSHAGTIRTTLAGLDAWGERWIRLQIAELDIDAVFEITSMSLNQADMTVTMEVASYDDWWEWTAATDEQDPAVPPPDTDEDTDVPVPESVAVTIEHRALNGQTYAAIGVIAWDPPPRSVYVGRARYRPVTVPASPWQLLYAEQDENTVSTPPLIDGQGYEAQARFIGPRGSPSDWSASTVFTAVADPNAPGIPTGLTAMVDDGDVHLSATAPNSANQAAVRFWRAATNDANAATDISGAIVTPANGLATYKDEAPGIGDWWYFATSENWSGVQSAKTAGVLAELPPEPVAILSPTPPGPVSSYDRRPEVSGNGAAAAAAIKLYANAVQVGTATAAGDGTWSVTPSTDLGIGSNAMTATQTVAGNESVASGAVAITVNAIDADAWAYIEAMTVRPPYARQTLIKACIEGLKADGVWSSLDGIYLMAAHDAQAARINAAAPSSVAVAAGSPTFTTDRGYTGAISSDIDTGFNPATAGGSYALNSMMLAVYGTATVAGNDNPPLTVGTGGTSSNGRITPRTTTDSLGGRANDAVFNGAANTATIGMASIRRSASTAKQADWEGIQVGSAATASTSISSGTIRVLHGTGSAVSNVRVGAVAFGGYLDDTKILALRDRLHTYLQAVGAVS